MFKGKVIHGNVRGRKYGFPTANLDINVDEINLKGGVYAALASINNQKFSAALAIQSELNKIEIHLIDYNGPDFYGEYLEVEPIKKISEIIKIDSEEELKDKIERDIENIKLILKN